MSRLLVETVVQACQEAGFLVVYDPQQELGVALVQLEATSVTVLLRADEQRRQVILAVPGLLTVPEERREAMAVALSRWNFDHLPMLLAMDPEDGELRAALLLELGDHGDPVTAAARSLTQLVSMVDHAYPLLARLRWSARSSRRLERKVAQQVSEILRGLPDAPP